MSETGHTPGPWTYLPEDQMIETASPVNLRGEYEHICDLRADLAGNVQEANARLIAAAPELLVALTDALYALQCCELPPDFNERLAEAKKHPPTTYCAALAKAIGANP